MWFVFCLVYIFLILYVLLIVHFLHSVNMYMMYMYLQYVFASPFTSLKIKYLEFGKAAATVFRVSTFQPPQWWIKRLWPPHRHLSPLRETVGQRFFASEARCSSLGDLKDKIALCGTRNSTFFFRGNVVGSLGSWRLCSENYLSFRKWVTHILGLDQSRGRCCAGTCLELGL